MTFAAVASLSQTIHLILNNHQEFISHEFKSKITSLHEHIIFLQSFLEESPGETHRWEARIRKVTNEAEDIIELLLSDSLLDSAAGSSRSKLESGICEPSYGLDELERATEEIESIAKEVRERHSESEGSSDGELMQIIDRLCGGPRGLEVLPIVGIGGIGKTTLAAAVYNHPLVVNTFKRRGWVTVSKNHRWERVISELVRSMGDKFKRDDSYDDKLLKTLSFWRYLIVVDDLWSVELWEKIESLIPSNINGSRIVITTRQLDVARRVRFYSRIHEMCSMNVNQSWNLLRRSVFKEADCPPKLEWMGKMIAESCRGIPLAIEAVSGILGADSTLAAWKDVADNINDIDCEADDEHVLRILRLSYAYLPPYLRPCLLYFGIFPEGQEIEAFKLKRLWEAEGFVNDSESGSIEGIGEKYLEDLAVKRNLVRVRKRRNGGITNVGVHDMVREMCIRQARADKFCVHVGRNIDDLPVEAIELERRLGIYENNNGILENVNGSTIRTIICFEGNHHDFRQLLGCSRLLRILDFSHAPYLTNKIDLGEELFELFHLRYLCFYYVSRIPKAISKLENLQTLIIHSTMPVAFIPEEVWRMRQLRRLFVRYLVVETQSIDPAIRGVQNLERATKAIDLNCSRLMLKVNPIPLGKFTYERWADSQILKVEAIRLMRIVISRYLKMKPAFHPSLKKLSLSGLGLPWEYMSIVASLPKLRTLKLENGCCSGSTWKTYKGGFCELEYLMIHDSDVIDWITKSSHFPKLRFLKLSACSDLREIPDAMGQIPTLELIELDHSEGSSLRGSPNRIRHQQQSLGNHSFRIRFSQPKTSHF